MELNWDAIGAAGEIAGAIAVVVSLLYLARETGRNARALDATSIREFGFRLSEWHQNVARDPGMKALIIKSASPELGEYTDSEWWETRICCISLFLIYQTSYMHLRLDLGHREEAMNYVQIARDLIDSFPAWRKFWDDETKSGMFTAEFIEAVNSAPSGGSGSFPTLTGESKF